MGYAEKTIGIGQIKLPQKGYQFKLVMKKRGKIRKPSEKRVESTVIKGSRIRVKRQVEHQTKYRLYRGDLSRMAIRRIWKIQQTRAHYKRFLRREARLAEYDEDEDEEDDEDDTNKANEDLVEVD
eukprot:UN08195